MLSQAKDSCDERRLKAATAGKKDSACTVFLDFYFETFKMCIILLILGIYPLLQCAVRRKIQRD